MKGGETVPAVVTLSDEEAVLPLQRCYGRGQVRMRPRNLPTDGSGFCPQIGTDSAAGRIALRRRCLWARTSISYTEGPFLSSESSSYFRLPYMSMFHASIYPGAPTSRGAPLFSPACAPPRSLSRSPLPSPPQPA